MALEAVVFQQGLLGYSTKEPYNLLGGAAGNWSYDFGLQQKEEHNNNNNNNNNNGCSSGSFDFLDNQTEHFLHGDHPPSNSMLPPFNHLNLTNYPSSSDAANTASTDGLIISTTATTSIATPSSSTMPPTSTRAKRRRSRSRKNKEEIENQRMTHIAVERNRRKQMNEYLSVLRSLMPESYVQRGDQASIIGGAINFVKELEQRLQALGAQKGRKGKSDDEGSDNSSLLLPFSEFFTFPQYSTRCDSLIEAMGDHDHQTQSTIADIEVTMVDSHANLKIRSKRRPKQLLKVVYGLHTMRLTILHLNVTTVDQIVLYSLSVKVEDDCKLTSVDEIATAVYQMIVRIQEESMLN